MLRQSNTLLVSFYNKNDFLIKKLRSSINKNWGKFLGQNLFQIIRQNSLGNVLEQKIEGLWENLGINMYQFRK